MFCKSVQSVCQSLTMQIYKRFLYLQNYFILFFKKIAVWAQDSKSVRAMACFSPTATIKHKSQNP